MRPSYRVSGAGRGSSRAWTAAFDRFQLGGESVSNNHLSVADVELQDDMLLGIDFFLSHRIYVSKKRSRMFFTYNGGPVFALNVDAPAATAAAGAAADASSAQALTADELARRGAASLSRNDLPAALADLDRACAMEPGNAAFFVTRAQAHAKQQDLALTLADLDAALRIDPAQVSARLQRATMLAAQGQPNRSLEDLAALDATLAPQSAERADMARLYASMNRPAQAIAQWTPWIAAHPHDIGREGAWNGRCWARMELDIELDKALDDCDAAVDADGKNATYLDGRAWVRLRQGDLKKSLDDFDRSLAIKQNAWALYGRALARQGLGDAAAAQADLAAARKLDPRIDAQARKRGLPVAP